MKRILFVCKHNRFRSRFAEAFFNKYNKNKNYIADSAGIIRGRYPLDKKETEAGKKIGISIEGKPKGLSSELLFLQDMVVIVADDVPSSIFKNRKNKNKVNLEVRVWKIADTKTYKKMEIEGIIKDIEEKIVRFSRELNE